LTTSTTDESKLVSRDGIVYTQKNKPFTGVSIIEDWIICPQEQEVISKDNPMEWTASGESSILDNPEYQTWMEAYPKDDSDANIKAWLETHPKGVTIAYEDEDEDEDELKVKETHDDKRVKGLRITHYKNGLKHGKEKHYYTNDIILFGNRTELHCTTIYENGQVIDHQLD
jgi:antitoxin component YwqK of YwqJK toxin-antitoxin module